MEEKYLEILTQTVERSKANAHQIEEVKSDIKEIKEEYKVLNKLATSIELIAQDMTTVKDNMSEVKSTQSEMKAELSEVKNESIRRKAGMFDSMWQKVATAVGAGVLAFVLGTMFPAIFK